MKKPLSGHAPLYADGEPLKQQSHRDTPTLVLL